MLQTNSLIVILIIGLIAGWLAGQIMKGGGYRPDRRPDRRRDRRLHRRLALGVLHLPVLGPWWLTAIVSAVIGACILLFLLRLIKR